MSNLVLDGHKLQWHQDRLRDWSEGKRIAPITIDWALTRSCTYKCIYCYGQLQTNDIKKITRKVAFDFLDDAAEIGVKAVSLVSDGESTCSPIFYDTIQHGKAVGLDMAVGTNGLLLDKRKLPFILPLLTYLRFNISAGEPEDYSKIHGVPLDNYYKVISIIKESSRIKKELNLPVTIGLQMVLMPQYPDQIMPLVSLGSQLKVDYLVIKHCSDDEFGSLGVDYNKYKELEVLLKLAERRSTDSYKVIVKWSKILSGGKRSYSKCYGPPFILQVSGSGLVAPCGMLFNERYAEKYHIGNIAETGFKDLWTSDRYCEVMSRIQSREFDAKTMCGTLCLQHKVNEFLDNVKNGTERLNITSGLRPDHINFI